ncbi:hypothetical protein Cgig2_021005 [Carnegiea gigantea]|uniref:Transmembrane protein n=1 Tax=Carnegiea gigantea TaxID=171969 RepID=A0A9Q1KAZ1_9CARY|nr:hypothetical protein Cgig2_021005 [Carnegiea gigantea]
MNEPPDPLPFLSHLPSRSPLSSLIVSSVRVNLLFPWNSFACVTFHTRLYACLYSDLPLEFRISLLFCAACVVSSTGGIAIIIASIVGHDPKPWPRTRLVAPQVPSGKIHLTSPFPAMIMTVMVLRVMAWHVEATLYITLKNLRNMARPKRITSAPAGVSRKDNVNEYEMQWKDNVNEYERQRELNI